MQLKLKKEYEETFIWVPFVNSNVMGKFIDSGLYTHLYKLYPDAFESANVKVLKQKVEEIKKEEKVNDILINNGTDEGNITE